jgi:hypothetical protein
MWIQRVEDCLSLVWGWELNHVHVQQNAQYTAGLDELPTFVRLIVRLSANQL